MKRPLIAMVLALALPAAAQAGGDYGYVEVGYATTETALIDYYSPFIDDYQGVAVRASWRYGGNWYSTLEARRGSTNGGARLDGFASLGLGYHWAMNDKADWFVEGRVAREEDELNADSDQYSVQIGLQGGTGSWYGLVSAGYEHQNNRYSVLDIDQGFVRVGGGYRFSERWSIGLEYRHGFEGTSAGFIGPRFSF